MEVKHCKVTHNSIHYCPKCLIEDFNLYGEVFVHRMHQLGFLHFCPKHKVKLIYKCSVCNDLLAKTYDSKLISLPVCSNSHVLDFNEEYEDTYALEMYKDLCFIMKQPKEFNREKIIFNLEQISIQKGYIFNQRINRQRVFTEMLEKLPTTYLQSIGITREYILSTDVQGSIFSNNSISDIKLYILLFKFLAGSVKDFCELEFVNSENSSDKLDESLFNNNLKLVSGYKEFSATIELNKRVKREVLDWQQLDKELVTKIKIAAETIYKENPPRPIRNYN